MKDTTTNDDNFTNSISKIVRFGRTVNPVMNLFYVIVKRDNISI